MTADSKPTTSVPTNLYMDLGNSNIRAIQTGLKPLVIKSQCAPVLAGMTEKEASDSSPITRWNDITLHWGEQASKYRTFTTVVEEGKATLVKTLASAAIRSQRGSSNLQIKAYLTVPHANYKKAYDTLKGKHRFTRNGVRFDVDVTEVHYLQESHAAALYCLNSGLLKPDGLTLVVDAGCGTLNTLVVDNATGEMVGEFGSSENYGCILLARMIAEDNRLRSALSDEPWPHVIMDCMENGTWAYAYTGVNFKDIAQEHIASYFKRVSKVALNRAAQYRSSIRSVLWVGGTTNLFRDLVAGSEMMIIPDEPGLANLRGLEQYFTND